MASQTDEVWKSPAVTNLFLEGVRAALPLAQEQIETMLRLIAASGIPVRSVLDVGCGDGVLASALVARFPEARAVLTDFSAPMLDAARTRLAPHVDRVRVVNADYGDPSWTAAVESGGPFDAIVSGYSIHHQPDTRKREVYREIFGMLRPGGCFINIEHVSSASPWIESVHDDLFLDHLHRLHQGESREEVDRKYHHRPDKAANILAPVEAQCEWLREIGFTDVDCYLKIFELAVFGGRKPAPGA